MNRIHPTAIVGPDVQFGDNNTVEPYAILDGEVVIGNGNSIGPHVVVYGPCTIGDDNLIESHAVINTTSAIRDRLERGTTIGSRNVLKEFVSIGGRSSTVGDDCFLMDKAHVAHNCRVGNFVTMASSAILGGHVVVGDFATLGLGVSVHQRLTIGEGAMVGMNAAVTKDVEPWNTVVGSPARSIGLNTKGMEIWGRGPERAAE
jgi:UDP-N-acetylglucosamine acyltransferase